MQTPMHCFYRTKDSLLNKLLTIYSIHLPQIYLSCDLHSYLGSAYHDKQNGSQRFILRAKIAELWWFKASKVENDDKENKLLFFKPGLW